MTSSQNGGASVSLDNIEEVLMELNNFEKRKSDSDDIPKILDDYLAFVAKTGNTHFAWPIIKPLFKSKLETVIRRVAQNSEEVPPMPNVDAFRFNAVKEKVFEQLEFFAGIPFTVQRLCELLMAPSKHYKRTDKFMRALEKNMLIVSTVETVNPTPQTNNNDSVSNGIDSFASTLEQRELSERQKLKDREEEAEEGDLESSKEDEKEEDDEESSSSLTTTATTTTTTTTASTSRKVENGDENSNNSNKSDLDNSGPCDSNEDSLSTTTIPISNGDSSVESSKDETEKEPPEKEPNSIDVETNEEDEREVQVRKEETMDIDHECSSSDNHIRTSETSKEEEEEKEEEASSTKKMRLEEEESNGRLSPENNSAEGTDESPKKEEQDESPSSSIEEDGRKSFDDERVMPSSSAESSDASSSEAADGVSTSESADKKEPTDDSTPTSSDETESPAEASVADDESKSPDETPSTS